MSNSCKDCKERFVGCHSTCESYKEYKIDHDKKMEMIKQKKKDNALFMEYKVKKMRKETSGKW